MSRVVGDVGTHTHTYSSLILLLLDRSFMNSAEPQKPQTQSKVPHIVISSTISSLSRSLNSLNVPKETLIIRTYVILVQNVALARVRRSET
jgi:hypothetical protein